MTIEDKELLLKDLCARLPYGQEVIGYNKEWVHEDFNPSGTRIGFLTDIGFISVK